MPKLLKIFLSAFFFLCLPVVSSLWAPDAHAQMYRWTDDQGRRSFTDDPSSIPFKYQKNMEKVFSAPTPRNPLLHTEAPEPQETKKEEQVSPFSRSTAKEEPQLTPEETSAINEALGFLNADIARYTPYIDKPVDLNIDHVVRGALDQKIALADKLSAFKLEVLKKTASFLKASAKEDEDARRLSPNNSLRKARSVQRRDRAKTEQETKTALIKELEEALIPKESEAEKAKK
jgi:hypothetical protein